MRIKAFITSVLLAVSATIATPAELLPPPLFKWNLATGAPAEGYCIYTYESGTTTNQTTYTDGTQTTANANPVVLNSRGEAAIYFDKSLSYKIIVHAPSGGSCPGSPTSPELTVDNYGGGSTSETEKDANLVTNGSFETDDNGDGDPDSWTETAYTGGTVSLVTNAQAHGATSYKFVSTGNGGGYFVSDSFIPISPARVLIISTMLKSSVAGVRNLVEVLWYDSAQDALTGGDVQTDVYDEAVANPTSWTKKSAEITPPSTAYYAKLKLYGAHSSDATSGTTWYDDVRITTKEWTDYTPIPINLDNIALNAFRIAINGSISVQGMVDGVVDEYEDETGVDTGTSTGESYDATGDYYSNLASTQEIYDETNQSSVYNMRGSQDPEVGHSFTNTTTGTTSTVSLWFKKTNSPTGTAVVEFYNATGTIGTSGIPTGASIATSNTFDVSTLTTSYQWISFTFASPVSLTAATDYAIAIQYTGGDGSNFVSPGADNTSPTHGGNLFKSATVGSGWSAQSGEDLIFKFTVSGGGVDMVFVSNATEAVAEPTKGRVVAFVEPMESITLNTDLKCYMSLDNGANYNEITLADTGEYASGKDIYSGTLSSFAQSGDQTMKYKCTTHNSKEVRIHGIGFFWE